MLTTRPRKPAVHIDYIDFYQFTGIISQNLLTSESYVIIKIETLKSCVGIKKSVR